MLSVLSPLAADAFTSVIKGKVYQSNGTFTGYHLTEYVDCVDETDNCYSYYYYGNKSGKGVRLDTYYSSTPCEEYTRLTQTGISKVRRKFVSLTGASISPDYDYCYLRNSNGTIQIYLFNNGRVKRCWIYRNSKLTLTGTIR